MRTQAERDACVMTTKPARSSVLNLVVEPLISVEN
jgi:hypothetical protein